ncbi:MAG: DNA-processing protein DprA [Pseudomonadota bacterium]
MKATSPLTFAERLARLRLARTPRVGPVTYRQLIANFGSAVDALSALPDLARRGGARERVVPYSERAAKEEIAAIEALGAAWLVLGEPAYPRLLAATEDAPPVLVFKGARHLLDQQCVALVGARNASAAGRKMAQLIADGLGKAGYIVVSGLARGIDTAAHQASLRTGTVAVVAGGLDVAYPPENASLQEAIAAQGALVSEMPPASQPQARHFPRRNRIISGLCRGVVVVEAAARSGSLITARLAGEQGREVMAVPGSPLDPRAQGANALIRSGAALVQSAGDVIEVLEALGHYDAGEPERPFIEAAAAPLEPGEKDRARLTESLSFTAISVDELIRMTGLAPGVVATILLELELAGRLERHAGNKVSLAPDGRENG